MESLPSLIHWNAWTIAITYTQYESLAVVQKFCWRGLYVYHLIGLGRRWHVFVCVARSLQSWQDVGANVVLMTERECSWSLRFIIWIVQAVPSCLPKYRIIFSEPIWCICEQGHDPTSIALNIAVYQPQPGLVDERKLCYRERSHVLVSIIIL